jgi:hypothetical protein
MDSNKPNPFLDRINKKHAAEDEEARKQRLKEEEAQQRREKLEAEGPSIARTNIEHFKTEIAHSVGLVKRDFALPATPQKNSDIEIVIKKDWLFTVDLSATDLLIRLFYLPAQGNPRMREKADSLHQMRYKLTLAKDNKWGWKLDSSPVRALPFSIKQKVFTITPVNSSVVLSQDMSQVILSNAADALDWVNENGADFAGGM